MHTKYMINKKVFKLWKQTKKCDKKLKISNNNSF